MGNYLEKGSHTFEENEENIRPDVMEEPPNLPEQNSLHSTSTNSIELAREAGESIDFHIFSYKQYVGCKQRQVFRWAAAKLALTEELIRINQLRNVQLQQSSYFEPETDYLSDDEAEEVPVQQQLDSLENYRGELVQLLGRLSLDHRPKSKKKKSKKSKKRRLMPKYIEKTKDKPLDNDSLVADASKSCPSSSSSKLSKRAPLKVKNC